MNFNLNEDQLAYVELAQQFSVNELAPMRRAGMLRLFFP